MAQGLAKLHKVRHKVWPGETRLSQGLHAMQAVDFKKALGCEGVGVLDMGAGSGLLSMMAARYTYYNASIAFAA